VWLVGAAGDPRHLSPLAVHALSTADAIIHDPGISKAVLDLVRPPHYREAVAPLLAIERVIELAEDGWRVVQLVEGDTLERAVEGSVRCVEHNVPFRIVTNAGEPLGGDAPLGLVLVRKPMSSRGADPQSRLILLIATPRSDASEIARRQRPFDFSMSGLAG
jgi:uroporphyrin-III C-methyltransferase